MKINWSKFYHIYLAIVSFVSILVVSINLWVILTNIGKYFIISDEEYLQHGEFYRLENCKNPIYEGKINSSWVVAINWTGSWTRKPSDEEIARCEEKVRKEVSFSRKYDLKDRFITSWSWFVVFLILFLFHYPRFLKIKQDD